LFWASLHGIAELTRTKRFPRSRQKERVRALVELFTNFRPTSGTKESTYQGTWFRTQPEDAADKESLQPSSNFVS
jgi:hypothetical protein